MALTRTIYTQGNVKISSGATDTWAVLSGVQNASYSLNTPRENVNQFGAKGLIDKVQVAPTEATITCSFIIPSKAQADTDLGNHITADELNALMSIGSADTHNELITVTAGGLGAISGAVLTSINVSANAGELATMELTFQGKPLTDPVDTDGEAAGSKVTPAVATTFNVVTSQFVSGFANGVATAFTGADPSTTPASGDCVRTASFTWEMPVERMQCLGESVNTPMLFGTPPGTASIALEGSNIPNMANISGLVVGPYIFAIGGRLDVVSREHSMAVGDVAANFTVNYEGTADAAACTAS